jgi:hypothetical protein
MSIRQACLQPSSSLKHFVFHPPKFIKRDAAIALEPGADKLFHCWNNARQQSIVEPCGPIVLKVY